MNVRVRFLSVATLVALTSSAIPIAAQSVTRAGLSDDSAAVAVALPSLPGASRLSLVDLGTPAARAAAHDSSAVARRGPSIASARVAARQVSTSRAEAPVLQEQKSNKRALALMIVGGAALVIGAVIGDDAGTIVMLGGAAVGLYGLYMFLT